MQYFSIGGLLNEDSFAVLVLVAAVDVVVEGELGGRRYLFGFGGLLHCYMFPFLLPVVLEQVEVDFVESLVDGVGNDGLCFF